MPEPGHTTTKGSKASRPPKRPRPAYHLPPPQGIRVQAAVRVPLESLAVLDGPQLAAFLGGVAEVIAAGRQPDPPPVRALTGAPRE